MRGPTSKAWEVAYGVQKRTAADEMVSTTEANERDVAVATVHGRQDLILIASMQAALHDQLVIISRGVWALVALGLVLVLGRLLH
jgi:hypothetical protein